MSKKEEAQWETAKQEDKIELMLAIGDLAVAADLMRKGDLMGMVEASKLLRNVWGKLRGRLYPSKHEEWKTVAYKFGELATEYSKRAREVTGKIIEESESHSGLM